jgi:hypothetical protein
MKPDRATDGFVLRTLGDITLLVPEAWIVRSTITMRPDDHSPDGSGAIIVREPMEENESLMEAASRKLCELGSLPHARSLGPNPIQFHGRPAVEVTYEWLADGETIGQVHVFFADDSDHGPVLTQITLTYLASDYEWVESIFSTMIDSVRFGHRRRQISAILAK